MFIESSALNTDRPINLKVSFSDINMDHRDDTYNSEDIWSTDSAVRCRCVQHHGCVQCAVSMIMRSLCCTHLNYYNKNSKLWVGGRAPTRSRNFHSCMHASMNCTRMVPFSVPYVLTPSPVTFENPAYLYRCMKTHGLAVEVELTEHGQPCSFIVDRQQ